MNTHHSRRDFLKGTAGLTLAHAPPCFADHTFSGRPYSVT